MTGEMNSAVRRRVYGFLRLARSENPHEAEVARKRARELMDRHGVEVSDAELDETSATIVLQGAWQRDLLVFVAGAYACRVLRSEARRDSIVVGNPADVRRAVRAFELVVTQVVSCCLVTWNRRKYGFVFDDYFEVELDELDAGFLTVLAIEMTAKSPDAAKYFGSDQGFYAAKLRVLASKTFLLRVTKVAAVESEAETESVTISGVKIQLGPRAKAKILKSEPSMAESLGEVFEQELAAMNGEVDKAQKDVGADRVSIVIEAAMRAGKDLARTVVWRIETPLLAKESTFPPDLEELYKRELFLD